MSKLVHPLGQLRQTLLEMGGVIGQAVGTIDALASLLSETQESKKNGKVIPCRHKGCKETFTVYSTRTSHEKRVHGLDLRKKKA